MDRQTAAIIQVITSVLYVAAIFVNYIPGTFIKTFHQKVVTASCLTGFLFSILTSIELFMGRQAGFVELFLFAGFFVIAYIISSVLINHVLNRYLGKLDQFAESEITIDEYKNSLELIQGITIGMKFSHQCCIDWSIFRAGTEKFPDSSLLWCVFAKYVAIYPDEENTLVYIIHSIFSHKLHGNQIKQTVAQAQNICKQRDVSLSPELKGQIAKTAAFVQVTKRKLRHVWDLVIQGTMNEMESSISNAFVSMNLTRSNYNHLLSSYPNNRFVARSYHRFLIEVDGDYQKIMEMQDIIKNIQRGMRVKEDLANILGTHAYPDLVHEEQMNNMSNSMNSHTLDGIDMIPSEIIQDTVEENTQIQNDQLSLIRERIRSLKIPAITLMTWWTLIMYFIVLLVPVIGLLVFSPVYLSNIQTPLDYIYHLSFLRSFNYLLPIFTYHLVFEQMGMFNPPVFDPLPLAYGYNDNTEGALRYMITQAANSLQLLNQFETYELSDPNIAKAHKLIFGGMKYMYFSGPTEYKIYNYSLQTIMTDYILQINLIIDSGDYSWDLLDTAKIRNPYLNFNTVGNDISEALEDIKNYLSNNSIMVTNLIIFIAFFTSMFYCFILGGFAIFQIHTLQQNKKMIYKCLVSLPKNVVSTISEGLRILKADEDTSRASEADAEMSKQEENVLKIFASASDNSSLKSKEYTLFLVYSLAIIILVIACDILIAKIFPSVTNTLRDSAPHLDYVLGSIGYGFSIFGSLNNIIGTTNGHGIAPDYDVPLYSDNYYKWIKELIDRGRSRADQYISYYQYARYGKYIEQNNKSNSVLNDAIYEAPYSKFQFHLEHADMNNECSNEILYPSVLKDNYRCLNIEFQINLVEPLMELFFTPLYENKTSHIDPQSELFDEFWYLVTISLYDNLFYPMFDDIVPTMRSLLVDAVSSPRGSIVCVLLLIFVFVIIIFNLIYNSHQQMKFALSLLLHCPPSAVLQSPKIVNLLAGDFSSITRDTTNRSFDFFNSIVHSLPDSIIITNPEGVIERVNKATPRIFGEKSSLDQENSNILDFFTTENFSEEIQNIFKQEKVDVEYLQEGKKKYFEITRRDFGRNTVYETRDKTQAVLYNTLISEERAKSDHLLSSILPPNLVKRVAAGEKNISFAVQSATILFLDIVEFTPWCASLTAAVVMQTLNRLFRMFDSKLLCHETLTKVKCIGDCYMAAGGIFVEINDPATHAKEVCEFGLETIQAVNENNKDHNMSLRIRVGINTGGPLVVGVLGTEKPTFEILGPVINMAQQMEHHGVPMKVHISRSVYEFIYGGSFNVKERGEISIKNGNVVTYLIESSQ